MRRLKEGIWAIYSGSTMANAVRQKGNEWIKAFSLLLSGNWLELQ